MLHRQPTLEEIDAALAKAEAMPPEEHFAGMVRRGIINWQGKVTRLCGGDVEPEPEALEYLAQRTAMNGAPPVSLAKDASPPANGKSNKR